MAAAAANVAGPRDDLGAMRITAAPASAAASAGHHNIGRHPVARAISGARLIESCRSMPR